jgi:hypothetical protein
MKSIFVFFLLAATTVYAGPFWDASKSKDLGSVYKAYAGPVWTTPGPHLDMTKTPPDSYRVSVEQKTATGSQPLAEKTFPIDEVDWKRLKTSEVDQIIKYHEPTRRVGFFLKGEFATFVHPLPTAQQATESVTPDTGPSTAAATAFPVLAGPMAADLDKAKRFVPSVVYHVEKGTKEYKTKRWMKFPRLEIVGKDPELTALATKLHTTIFEAAGPLPAGEGKIVVYIGPAKELVPVRKKILPQSTDQSWSNWSNWNTSRELTGGVIFIITDRMDIPEARRALAQSFMCVVGFPDQSREYRESILHPESRAYELAPIDKRLISFIYKHTEPGLGREALLAKMSQYWQ